MLSLKWLKPSLTSITPEPKATAAGTHFTPFNSLADNKNSNLPLGGHSSSDHVENSPLPPPGLPPPPPGLPPPPPGPPPQLGPPLPSLPSPSLVPGGSKSSSSSSLVNRLQVASQSALSRNLNKGVQLEIKVHSCLRSTSKKGRILVVAGLAVVLVGLFLVPLALGGGSFYEANRICCERHLAFWEEAGYRDYHGDDPAPWDVECEAGSVTWVIPESASHILIFPGFFFNTVSAIVSFAGAVYWLFFSPHRFNTAEIDAELDRKLMSFLLTQCVSQFCVLVSALWSCCPNAIASFIVFSMYNGASFGGSIIATNVLCHRHLFAQAKYMARSAPDEDTNEKLILLEKACKWQLLSILMIAPPCTILQGMAALSPIINLVNYFVLGAFTLILFVVDGTITIILTFLYLRPITKVEGSIVPPGVREKLQRARRLTVAGVSLMVFSTSALYLNIFVTFVQLIFVKTGDSFLADPYLNPLSFGMNLDCLLNIVGMVVVCEGTRKPTENKNVQPGRSDVTDGKKRRPDSSRNVY